MINLSDLISMQVLNLYSGRIEGTIKDVCFDEKYTRIVSLMLFDNDEEEYTFPASKIYALGDYVVIKNNDNMVSTINQIEIHCNNPIGKTTFSTKGQDLGLLQDIILNDNLTIKEYISSKKNFSPAQLVNVSKSIIINLTDKKVSLSNFRPHVKLLPIDNKVKIMAIESPAPQSTPQKFLGNSEFLIGRTTTQNIYSLDNHILAPKGTIITPKILSTLKSHGKLSETTLYSKK